MATLQLVGFFVASKVGKTGLADVAVDVWRVTIADGTSSEVVTAGACTEIGDGLYRYTLAGADLSLYQYFGVFKTADSSVDAQHVAGSFMVLPDALVSSRAIAGDAMALTSGERTTLATAVWASATRTLTSFGTLVTDIWAAGTRTLTSFGTLVTDIWAATTRTLTSFGTLAADVWAYASRTLTQPAAQVRSILDGDDLTIVRGDTLTVNFTGLGNISTRSKLWFTLKRKDSDLDDDAILQVEETAGLLYANGAAASSSLLGTLLVTNATTGAVTMTIDETVTDDLTVRKGLLWDVQMKTAAGVVTTLQAGDAEVTADVTRAVA